MGFRSDDFLFLPWGLFVITSSRVGRELNMLVFRWKISAETTEGEAPQVPPSTPPLGLTIHFDGGGLVVIIYTPQKNLTARTLKMMVFQKESPFPGIYSIFTCYVKFRGSIYPPHKAFGETSQSNMSQVNILWRQPDLTSSSMFFVNLFREDCWNSNCKTSPTN